jgi:hypothetical protein
MNGNRKSFAFEGLSNRSHPGQFQSPTLSYGSRLMQYGRTEVTARQAFLQGVRELLPPAPGIFAWGLVTGVAMVKSGLGPTPALLLTFGARHYT